MVDFFWCNFEHNAINISNENNIDTLQIFTINIYGKIYSKQIILSC